MIFQDMDRIVFAGDSVTDMGSQNPVGEGLFDSIGHSYVRVIENLLAALYPEVHLRVTNSGISGDNSQMLLARWERDVRALDPQWVSICIGINDVKGIFLMTPYYMEPNASDFMRARMDEYGAICKELAEEYGCIFIDLQAMFSKYCSVRHSSYLAWDRVHPNQIGATLIALEWLKHCELERLHTEDYK